MKAVQCQDCIHYVFHENRFTTKLYCDLKQKYINFYKPRYPHDDNCGWKARCKDFEKDILEFGTRIVLIK